MLKTLLLFFLLTPAAFGITLKEAERLAELEHPLVKELEQTQESLKLQQKTVERQRWGTVELNGGYSTYNRNYMLVPLSHLPTPLNQPPFDSRKAFYGLSLRVPLYTGGSILARVKVLKARELALKSLKRATKWQLKFNVDSVYLSVLALKAQEAALEDYRRSLLKLREDTEAGVKVGKFAKVDLLKVEYRLKEVEGELESVRARKEALIEALSALVGRKVKGVEEVKFTYRPERPSIEKLYREAVRRNSRIESLRREVSAARAERGVVEAKFGVKLSLEAKYLRNYGLDSGENEGYGEASVVVSFPVFTAGRKGLELLQNGREVLQKLYRLKAAERDLKREIADAVSELKKLQSQIEADRKKLTLAKEVERIEQLKYKSGKGDMDHLLLAKSERFLTEAQLKSLYYRWLIAKRRIEAILEVNDER